MNSHEYVPPGERVSDDLLAYLASAPEGVWVRADNPNHARDWSTLWEARRQNFVLARELQQARTALRLIAASLPTEYARTTDPEEPCMGLLITDLHADVLERLLDKPAKVTSATSAATVGALHELQAAGVVCRDQQDSDLWSIRTD